jgi:hypothetical protein
VKSLFEYFARKDLVVQGLVIFDERPENFRAWKLGFHNTINHAHMTPAEELDLLVKWTSSRAHEIVTKIRAVNVHNPAQGLCEAWERLDECYSRPEVVTKALLGKVKAFPRIDNNQNVKLREFSDLLYMLNAAKVELPGLCYLDTHLGVAEFVQKLPFSLQTKWRTRGKEYKDRHGVHFPPFEFFAGYVRKMADERNDPSFEITTPEASTRKANDKVVSRKTEVNNSRDYRADNSKECPIHKRPHPLHKCRLFREKPLEERFNILRDLKLCFRCCASTNHGSRECKSQSKCLECGSNRHATALHVDQEKSQAPATQHGEERNANKSDSVEKPSNAPNPSVSSTCTEICGYRQSLGKSCAKIVLVNVYPTGKPEMAEKVYALLDDQSNRSLVKPELFDALQLKGNASPYTLRTCSGLVQTQGRRAKDLTIESLDGKVHLSLPTLIECDDIPNNRSEIPIPSVARHYAHLRPIADYIPDIDNQAQILVLLGRDVLQVHKVREQRNGPGNSPFAQRLDLGWVIVGDVCLDGAHVCDNVGACKTFVYDNGRTSFLQPCPNKFLLREVHPRDRDYVNGSDYVKLGDIADTCSPEVEESDSQVRNNNFVSGRFEDGIGQTVFTRTKFDNRLGSSVEDSFSPSWTMRCSWILRTAGRRRCRLRNRVRCCPTTERRLTED